MRILIHDSRRQRDAVAKLQRGFFCVYCDATETSLVIDHVVPRRHGGSEDIRNLVLACNSCNIRKLDREEAQLAHFGHSELAERVAGIKAMRADWGPDEVKYLLAQPLKGVDPGYDRYEKFITETPTAKVINEALTFARMSSERLRRKAGLGGWTLDRLRWETQKGSINMWHRLSEATEYPVENFLAIHLSWISEQGTPQREFEYAAALRNLNSKMLGYHLQTQNMAKILRGEAPLQRTATDVALLLGIPKNKAAMLIKRINANVKVVPRPIPRPIPRPRPRPRPRPIPRPRPRPRPIPIPIPRVELNELWHGCWDRFVASLPLGDFKRNSTNLNSYLGITNSQSMRRLDKFPDTDLFRRICAVNNKEPDALIFELERLVLAIHGIELPDAMQSPQRSLAHVLYISQGQDTISYSSLGGLLSRGILSDSNRRMLAETLSLSLDVIGQAWDKTLYISREMRAKCDAELDAANEQNSDM